MKTLYIPIGIPGSGKTTYAKKVDATEVCFDSIKKRITGSYTSNKFSDEVRDEYLSSITEHSRLGENVYASSLNIVLKTIKNTVMAYHLGNEQEPFNVVLLLFDDSLNADDCISRIRRGIENHEERADVPSLMVASLSDIYKKTKRAILSRKEDFSEFGVNEVSIMIVKNNNADLV